MMMTRNSQAGMAIQSLIMIIAGLALVGGLAVPACQNLKVKALRAEAKVMLSYVATLESAHSADSGKYVFFDELYGSPIKGKDNCERPPGAIELGFMLRNCAKDPRMQGLRYTYRIEPSKNPDLGFKGIALSGSDLKGDSYVCFGVGVVDQWSIDATKVHKHEVDCQ